MAFWQRITTCLILVAICVGSLSIPASAQDKAAGESLSIPETNDGMPGAGPVRRYDWFKSLWNKRRGDWAKNVEQDQGAVVFFGDSITQGWGDDFKKHFASLKKANRGISGDTTRGMLYRLDKDVIALKPKAVIMLMGTNDLEEGASPEEVAGNVKLIIEQLKAADSKMPVVLCEVFPSSETKKRPADKIKKINELLQGVVASEPQVTLLDTWTLFANEKGDAKPEEFPDLLHPNDAGYVKWAGALNPILATLALTEISPSEFVPEQGFESLFNGKDLSGWGYRQTSAQMLKDRDGWKNHPEWPVIEKDVSFDGQAKSTDGRYAALNGKLVVTTPSAGRKIQQLYTTKDIKGDFTLKLEFRATPNADSGVFLMGPQLQCRDYQLAGPYKELKSYKPADWNQLEIVAQGGKAVCRCNGEIIEAEFKLPESGPIGLEGDRGQVEYRHIQIKTGR